MYTPTQTTLAMGMWLESLVSKDIAVVLNYYFILYFLLRMFCLALYLSSKEAITWLISRQAMSIRFLDMNLR